MKRPLLVLSLLLILCTVPGFGQASWRTTIRFTLLDFQGVPVTPERINAGEITIHANNIHGYRWDSTITYDCSDGSYLLSGETIGSVGLIVEHGSETMLVTLDSWRDTLRATLRFKPDVLLRVSEKETKVDIIHPPHGPFRSWWERAVPVRVAPYECVIDVVPSGPTGEWDFDIEAPVSLLPDEPAVPITVIGIRTSLIDVECWHCLTLEPPMAIERPEPTCPPDPALENAPVRSDRPTLK